MRSICCLTEGQHNGARKTRNHEKPGFAAGKMRPNAKAYLIIPLLFYKTILLFFGQSFCINRRELLVV